MIPGEEIAPGGLAGVTGGWARELVLKLADSVANRVLRSATRLEARGVSPEQAEIIDGVRQNIVRNYLRAHGGGVIHWERRADGVLVPRGLGGKL
jgi:hypothetical protein